MRLLVFSYNTVNDYTKDLVEDRLLNKYEIQWIVLRSALPPSPQKDQIYLIFGDKALILVKDNLEKVHLVFHCKDSDFDTQLEQSILQLQSHVCSDRVVPPDSQELLQTINKDSIPNLDFLTIARLREALLASGNSVWRCTTENGKIIELTLDKGSNEPADIRMSFEELLSLRLAMDIFKLKEVQFVRSSSENSSKKNST